MKKGVMVVLFMGVWVLGMGQVTFQKNLGEADSGPRGEAQQTIEGGYIAVGTNFISGVGDDVFLVKTNQYGDTIWTKSLGGGTTDEGWSIDETLDSGYIIAGYTWSFGARVFDIYLIRTDVNGNIIWSKTYGQDGDNRCYSVKQTTDSGFIMVGLTYKSLSGDNNMCLIRTDSNGDTLWTKTFGGTGFDIGYSVEQTTDGGYIAAGGTQSFGLVGMGYLIKTDSNGDTLWTKTISDTCNVVSNSIQQTSDAGYIITGLTTCVGQKAKVYLTKIDSVGNLLWSNVYGGTGNCVGNYVQQTNDNGYIIAGYTYSTDTLGDVFLIKTDSIGNILWSKNIGGAAEDYGFSAKQTSDGGYIVIGYTNSFGGRRVYLIKTDSNGNSGCYDGNPTTFTLTPATIMASTPTLIIPSSIFVRSPLTQVRTVDSVFTICQADMINELNGESTITLSPNPATNQFTITSEFGIKEITICNVLGERVYTEHLNTKYLPTGQAGKTLNTNLPAGIYFVRVSDEEKTVVRKLVVE